jgi:voltage-gated potassium channel
MTVRFRDLPPRMRAFEAVSIAATLYALATLFVELELNRTERVAGFWFWNELAVTAVFVAEYAIRWMLSRDWRYPLRAMAVIDLIAILPFFVGLVSTADGLGVVRVFRVIRILRLSRYSESFDTLAAVFARTRGELAVVGLVVAMAVAISSVLMFQLECNAVPDRNLNYSDAVWWSCATITTVGYGDVSPATYGGRVVGVATMLVGVCSYGVLLALFGGAWIDVLKERREAKKKQWTTDDATFSAANVRG